MSPVASLLPDAFGSGAPAALRAPAVQPLAIEITDPAGAVGGFLGGQIVEAVTALLRALSQDFLDQLAAPLARYVLSTPDLAAEPTLRAFWLVSLAVLAASAGLAVAISGIAVMLGRSSRIGQAAREGLTVRLAGGMLTAAVSLPLVALEVQFANLLVKAFIEEGFASGQNPLWETMRRAVGADAAAGLALLVTVMVGVILLIGLVVIGLARWASLWLLIVLAPIAMGFAVLPGGEGLARGWWRLQLATVFLPVANAVLLGTYVAMFSSEQSGLVGALSGVAVLGLMAKLPGWLAGSAMGVDGADVSGRLRRGRSSTRRAVHVVAGASGGPATASVAAVAGGRGARQGPSTGSIRPPRGVPKE